MSARIIQGDCLGALGELETGSVDAVIADPPYCSGAFTEEGRRQAKGQGLRSETVKDVGWFLNDNMGTAGLVWLLREVALEAWRVLKDDGSMCLFADWRMVANLAPALESTGMRMKNMLVWNKGHMGLGIGFRTQHEIILHFTKGGGKFYDCSTSNVLTYSRVSRGERIHQTEKPVELMAALIKVVTPPGGLVLDPFAGSGSTLVAAVQNGYQAIGIERDPGYVEVARRRIAEAEGAMPAGTVEGQMALFDQPA